MGIWITAGWLLIALFAMLLFRRWIEVHLQGLILLLTEQQGIAVWIFFMLFFPGILVHELSHWIMAKLLFVPTGRVTLWPHINRDGSVWLGTVEVGRSDPVRGSLVGLAPLISGSAVAVLISAHLQLERWGSAIVAQDWALLGDSIGTSTAMPDFWLWIYLLFAIANRMLPSPSDREPWKPVLLFLSVLALIWLATGWTLPLPSGAERFAANLLGFLTYAFTVTATINLAFILLLASLETLTGFLLQRRVTYNSH
jgi:hypothetical protein